MATMDSPRASEPPQKRKRASRKNTPKRFRCNYNNCTKIYSRHEHLQRHQLNHEPKELFRCPYEGCDQTFVRLDLCTRHQARHGEALTAEEQNVVHERQSGHTTDCNRDVNSSTQPTTDLTMMASHPSEAISTGPEVEREISDWITDEVSGNRPDFTLSSSQDVNDNFATWLFNSPGSQQQNFDLSSYLPYVDFGIDYCSPINDFWQVDSGQTAANITTKNSSIATNMPGVAFQSPHLHNRDDHSHISDVRRSSILHNIHLFLGRNRFRDMRNAAQEGGLLFDSPGQEFPNLTREVLESCLSLFWTHVAIQMPIIHQQTFSTQDCQLLLLLTMIMLGAGQMVRLHPAKTRDDYRVLADLLASNLRWEVLPEAEPPITLEIAQVLLLLEFYEKMFSTRRLHERANIHHASTLALLRRGSPMVGHAENEEPPTRCPSPGVIVQQTTRISKQLAWWQRWARNESWHRVVFAALQMDTLHAIAFGHESSLLPYEVRLPLPCDDSIWSAQSPEDVWRLEETFSMHGIGQQPFLDSLKRCLHGHEVQSNHGARIILGSGLLSIGWHISRRERNQQFLDTTPSAQEQERWRLLLLNAYSHWCQSFQKAINKSKVHSRNYESIKDIVFNPTILLRLAFITTHVDILDAQVFAGSKRLLGRKITEKDHLGCSTRMRNWAMSGSSRLAVAHAFELLDETFMDSNSLVGQTPNIIAKEQYTCRADASIYRPWILYLAALTIWSYQYALRTRQSRPASGRPAGQDRETCKNTACEYIQRCARPGINGVPDQMSSEGCAAVCTFLSKEFANSEWELLLEASRILDSCASSILDI